MLHRAPDDPRGGEPVAPGRAARDEAHRAQTVSVGTRPRPVRDLADRYVDAVCALRPQTGLDLGLGTVIGLDDVSPDGFAQAAELRRRTLGALTEAATGPDAAAAHTPALDPETTCARLLRERLGSELAFFDAGEDAANLSNIYAPPVAAWQSFAMLPAVSDPAALAPEDREAAHADVVTLLEQVPAAFSGWTATIEAGLADGPTAGPTVAETLTRIVGEWNDTGYWSGLAAAVPPALAARAHRAAAAATEATADLHAFLRQRYLPTVEGRTDGVGAERYLLHARRHLGSELDLRETYEWGWSELARINAEMRAQAQLVLPGAGVDEAFAHLGGPGGDVVEGVEAVRAYLQGLMDAAIETLDGGYFDITGPVRRVEAMIAPDGGAASPYYTQPSLDFSRPGRTWLPVGRQTRFALWDLVPKWFHEGVPGHHLQFARWIQIRDRLSTYQTTLGGVPADTEGWALYAERLAAELDLYRTPGELLGYLDTQRLRAVRVVVDIGMHCGFRVPADLTAADAGTGAGRSGVASTSGRREVSPLAGAPLTTAVGRALLRANCASPQEFIDSEIVRYLGAPAQAVSYKVGERVWLEGREHARRRALAEGRAFDLKAWHMDALDAGSLGLDDLARVLPGCGA